MSQLRLLENSKKSIQPLLFISLLMAISCHTNALNSEKAKTPTGPSKNLEQTIEVTTFSLSKYSPYMSDETIAGLQQQDTLKQKAFDACNPYTKQSAKDIRACEKKHYGVIMPHALNKFDVAIKADIIADVPVHVVSPNSGVNENNKDKVLINLHGGGFKFGGGYGGQLESMPLAHYGNYKVIAIDYKKAPEHKFPAANADVLAVYQHLLKSYKAKNIGIFGCSAGSRVAGQSIVSIADALLPMLGAAAFLCSAPTGLDGDSNVIAAALQQRDPLHIGVVEYWEGLQANNQQAFPGDFTEQLAKFPPSLLITSTRDYSLSPMVNMHQKLVLQNKVAQLHIFEGFTHGQFLSMYIPEHKTTADIMVRFFEQHLGQP
jgi:acetyl esterase/lipase